jgi:RNA polymerase sigma factor (sigma-70 family)
VQVTEGLAVLTRPLTRLIRDFRRSTAARASAESSDRALLTQFHHERDEIAFAVLVQRHGRMVYGVCRRVLHDPNDADDAFQAAFLVLARKAGSVSQPDRLGNWLYGVALRVAHKARSASARRRVRQQPVTDMPAPESRGEAEWNDVRQVLDDEVNGLPEKLRMPILLCYLQGRSREEAAEQLGWSAGAVKGMLERGRELLRRRLIRRGVTLSALSLAGMLAENARSAATPAALNEITIKAALLFAAGQAPAAGSAAVLAEGVLHAMWISKLKFALVALMALTIVGTGAVVLAVGSRPDPPEPAKQAAPAAKDDPAELPSKQAVTRRDLAKAAYQGYFLRFEAGLDTEQAVHLWSRRWLQAELDLSDKKADRDAARQAHLDRIKRVDEIARSREDLGVSAQPVGQPEKELKNFETVLQQFMSSKATPEEVSQASVRLLRAQHAYRKMAVPKLNVKDPGAKPLLDRIEETTGVDLRNDRSEFQTHLERVKKAESITRARWEAGMYSDMEFHVVSFHRVQAEQWLADRKSFRDK